MLKSQKFNRLFSSFLAFSLIMAIGSIGNNSLGGGMLAMAQTNTTTSEGEDSNLVLRAGPLTAVRHIFDDPTLRVFHYCTPHHLIMAVCTLFDSNQKNATLIGIEYMLTPDDYNKLPEREKPFWHYHVTEFAPDRADPHFPQLSAEDEKKVLKMIEDSYGKVILTWNPNDQLPAFPPQIPIVQHPDMVNKSSTPETHIGSYNQSLDY